MTDIIIVGSGFGGAVMAARLGAAARALRKDASVILLERGPDPTGTLDPHSIGGPLNAQGNRFRHTLDPAYLSSFAQIYTDPMGSYRPGVPSLNVVTGKGLGGGSNVYDGVSLRAPALAFEQVRDQRRLWPALYSRAALDPYYAIAERQLHVVRLAFTDAAVPHWQLNTKRDLVFAEGCRRIGATAVPLKVATDRDANEGWWNEGPRFEGRQGLSKNYLRDAQAAGVELRSGFEVRALTPKSGGYVVSGIDHRNNLPMDLECRMLILAGGTVGSTALLLRSRPAFADQRSLDPGNLLGREVSGNGDYGVTGIVGPDFAHDVEGHKGKPMSSFCPSFFTRDQFILIPFYAAPLYPALGQVSTLLRPREPAAVGRASTEPAEGELDFGLAYKQRLSRFGSRMLTMGCLTLDAGEGEVLLSPTGAPMVRWTRTDDATERRWSAAVSVMRRIYEALGGEMFLDVYRQEGTVQTSHPLGGCRMSESGADRLGVVDPFGEVFGNRNLFVVDSAIIPSALGVNPSLTITAVAELIADHLIRGIGTAALSDRIG